MSDNLAQLDNTEGRNGCDGTMTTPGRWSRRSLLQILGSIFVSAGFGHLLPKGSRADIAPGHPSWAALEKQLQGSLLTPELPWVNPTASVLKKLRNPFWIQEQPMGLQSTGWLGAWKAATSTRVIAAESGDPIRAFVQSPPGV